MGANTEGSSVHYQSEDEIDASKRQIIFTNIMDKGRLVKSATYKKVEVLMLCWAHSSDDMGTRGEVNDLKSVFESTFGYHAVIGQLDSTKPLQTQVNRIVAEFVDENNRPDTLLIVYYAGHGKPGGENSHLELIGQTSPNDPRDSDKKKRDRLVWDKTEDILREAGTDVLEIFDWQVFDLLHCYARSIGRIRGEYRLFEYLAASKNQDTTEIPGPSSFTSALIYALKSLSDEKEGGRFTTAELSKRIRTAPEFPKAQIPMLEDREDGPDRSYHDVGRIILHPLEKAGTPTEIPDEIALAPKHVLTLHFEFGGKPPDDNLTVFTSELRNAYEGQNIGLRRVRWGGERATTFARATRWFERGLNKRRESTRKQRPSQIDLQRVESSPAVSPNFLSPQSAIINHQGPACTNTPDSSPLSSSGLEDEYPSQKKKRRF